ncbi:MAG: hypothetical protein AAFV53_23300 [Myxococcota bacterium]
MAIPFNFRPLSAKSVLIGTDSLIAGTYYASAANTPSPSIYEAKQLDDGTVALFNEETDIQVSLANGTVIYPLQLSADKSTATPIAVS